jgi:hypothetical protein
VRFENGGADMPRVRWGVSVEEEGGPVVIADSDDVNAEATGEVHVTIEDADSDKEVTILPGGAADVYVMVIQASRYSSDVTYKAWDGSKDSKPVVLDGPQIFTTGSVSLFGVAPKSLKFTNGGVDPVDVAIYVARDATP